MEFYKFIRKFLIVNFHMGISQYIGIPKYQNCLDNTLIIFTISPNLQTEREYRGAVKIDIFPVTMGGL